LGELVSTNPWKKQVTQLWVVNRLSPHTLVKVVLTAHSTVHGVCMHHASCIPTHPRQLAHSVISRLSTVLWLMCMCMCVYVCLCSHVFPGPSFCVCYLCCSVVPVCVLLCVCAPVCVSRPLVLCVCVWVSGWVGVCVIQGCVVQRIP